MTEQPRKAPSRMRTLKEHEADFLFMTGLIIALLFFFRKALLGTRTLIWDAADYFYPYFYSVSSTLRQFDVPLWNPFLFNGFPTIANLEAQTFYPVNLLFLPFTAFTPYVVYLHIIFHFLLAGTSMFLLTGYYLKNRWARALSALVYTLSGFTVGHLEHVTMIEVMAWMPLVFLFLEKALAEKKHTHALLAGLFLGVSILAGHPQTSHAMIFVLAVHTFYRAAQVQSREKKRAFLVPLSALAICLITALLIAAVQILPTYELTRESIRSGPVPFELSAGSGQFALKDAPILVLPNYFGALTGPYWGDLDISQSILYIGVTPLLLVGCALLLSRKHTDVIYFFAMAVLFLLVSLGENGPVYRLLYSYVPGFNYFRSPVHTIFVYTFFAALLSAHGLNALADRVKAVLFYPYLGAFLILCFAVYYFGPDPPGAIADEAINNINAGFVECAIFVCAAALLASAAVSYSRVKKLSCLLLLLLTVADLYLHFADSFPIGEDATPSVYEEEPDSIKWIKKHEGIYPDKEPGIEMSDSALTKGLFRIYTEPRGIEGTGLVGYNRAMIFRTSIVDGFEPLEISRHRKLVDGLAVRNLDNLLKIANVKYRTDLSSQTITYYSESLPRVFIVPNARFMNDDDRLMEELAVFDPSSETVISGSGKDVVGRTLAPDEWKASVSRYTADEVEIRTHSVKDGFLVLSDTYYPGWRATVDGITRPILRANYDFRALVLPRGDHVVLFRYRPSSFLIGLFISIAGLLLSVFVLFYSLRREHSGKGYRQKSHLPRL